MSLQRLWTVVNNSLSLATDYKTWLIGLPDEAMGTLVLKQVEATCLTLIGN
jgi:hypothetical protein